ncbi:MAG: phosphoglycerate mutase family protein [Bdellovibrionota bacterium]
MKLVLFRHATRSPYEIGDASLNATGLSQANELPHLIAPQGPIPSPTHLFASPKKRAKQTLQILSDSVGLPVIVDENLDERKNSETIQEFETRVKAVFERVSKLESASTVFLCSHLDWLEAAATVWPTDLNQSSHSWGAGEYLIFKVEDGICLSKGGGVVSPLRPGR